MTRIRPNTRQAVAAMTVLALAVLTSITGLAVTAGPAQAHATLDASSPADGATREQPPTKVVLSFDEPVSTSADALTATSADGVRWDAGDANVLGSKLSASIKPGGPGGVWTITWRVVSADGHPVGGQLHFTVTGRPAPSATASTAASTSTGGGLGTGTIVVIVVAAVAMLAGIGFVATRRGRPDDPPG